MLALWTRGARRMAARAVDMATAVGAPALRSHTRAIHATGAAASLQHDDLPHATRRNAIRRFKPTSPGVRHRSVVDRSDLWKGAPIKQLTMGITKTGGRNHTGRITAWHRGGGHKRRYRVVDFRRSLWNVPAEVVRLEYDPNRSARVALLCYQNRVLSYILAPQGLRPGDNVIAGDKVDVKVGNAMPLKSFPVGSVVHCIEMKAGKGAQLARSAGTSAQLLEKNEAGYAVLRLQSKELRLVPLECMATVGVVSNADHKNAKKGKAGVNRWLGRRPKVRGVAMNPVDHPHGGGEGKASGGRPSVSPWGIPTKGYKTRRGARVSDKLILARRPKKRRS